MSLSPSLPTIIREAIEARLAELHVCLPAKVVKFDASIPCVDVQPLLLRVVVDEQQQEHEERLPMIQNVPVVYPGNSFWAITWPLVPGDTVLLVFAERSIDAWLGAAPGVEIDPGSSRKHDLSDAIAIPGLRPRTNPLPVSDMRIGAIEGDAAIVLKAGGTIEIGPGATSAMVLGDELEQVLKGMVISVSGSVGTVTSVPNMSDCLSTKAKVK